MPATLRERPLGICCSFSNGSRAELDLGAPEGSRLGRDLLVGLASLVHPHGSVDAASTVSHYLRAARHMVATLAGQGFVGGAGELTRAKLAEYWMAATVPFEACTRAMLVAFDAENGGLARDARELAGGRAFNPRRAQPPTVLTGDEMAALAEAWPTMVAGLDRDDMVDEASVLAELVGGQRDVFVAACADQLSGLHGPTGEPCPARPWVCLVCPLAVFAPRHAGNLLRLKAFFARQWQAMPANQFMSVFGPYAQAIDHILERYQPAVLAAAAGGVAGNDAELPLRPEELSR